MACELSQLGDELLGHTSEERRALGGILTTRPVCKQNVVKQVIPVILVAVDELLQLGFQRLAIQMLVIRSLLTKKAPCLIEQAVKRHLTPSYQNTTPTFCP